MLPIIKHRIVAKTLALLAVCATLFSFSSYRGGDTFRIFVNNKMIFEQHVWEKESLKSFELDKANYKDQLTVYYSHCGTVGKGRTIAIKDENNKTLKEWHYANVTSKTDGMSCKVGDILDLQKNKSGKLQLYYSSKELPEGKVLAAIAVGSKESKATR